MIRRGEIRSRAHESFVVQGDAALQPMRARNRTGHEKDMPDGMGLGNVQRRRFPDDSFQLTVALEGRYPGVHVQRDVGHFGNAADEVVRHCLLYTSPSPRDGLLY